MKKILIILPMLFLAGCMPMQKDSQLANSKPVKIINTTNNRSNTSGVIQNTISEEIKGELRKLYGYPNLTFSNVYSVENYVIADADIGDNAPGAFIQIVAGKVNDIRLKFYEGNSGDISCTITEKLGFPKDLLIAYNKELPCLIEGGEYTIPENTMKEKAIMSMGISSNMIKLLQYQCKNDTQNTCAKNLFGQLYYQWAKLPDGTYKIAFINKDENNKTKEDIFNYSPEIYIVDFSNGDVKRKRPIDGGLDVVMNIFTKQDANYLF